MDCHDSGCWRTRPDRFDALDRCLDCGRHWSDHRREYTPSEYDALRTALETAERERDEARAERDAAKTRAVEASAGLIVDLQRDRDAWKAKTEARPDITPEDARLMECVRAQVLACDLSDDTVASISSGPVDWRAVRRAVDEAVDRVFDALRAHASKAVR